MAVMMAMRSRRHGRVRGVVRIQDLGAERRKHRKGHGYGKYWSGVPTLSERLDNQHALMSCVDAFGIETLNIYRPLVRRPVPASALIIRVISTYSACTASSTGG